MFEFIMFVIFVILFAITIAIDADFINITNNIIIINNTLKFVKRY